MTVFAVAAKFCARLVWLWQHRLRFAGRARAANPRLLVDVSAIIRHDAQTGIQRVVRAVWSELRQRDGRGFDLVPVYATQTRGYCYAPLDFLEQPGAILPREPAQAHAGDKFLGLDLSAHFLPKYRQQVRAWRAHGATTHVIVYDLLPLLRPQWFNRTAAVHFRNWFAMLATDIDQAICISKQVSRDVRERLHDVAPASTLAITTMKMGGDIANSRPSEGICDEVSHLLDRLRFRPAILMVGTIEPRKGYEAALAAFERLWSERGSEAPDLVIVGKPGWKTAALQAYISNHAEHGRRLHWLREVSDEGLCRLYEASRGLLVASHGEGFGLPLAEAIMRGRPVLARDLPVFQEQNLPGVLFFEDERPAALADRIIDLVRAGPFAPGPLLDLPTWSECVEGLLREIGCAVEADADNQVALTAS